MSKLVQEKKVILITGAYGSIGKAITNELLRNDYDLILVDKHKIKSNNPNISSISFDLIDYVQDELFAKQINYEIKTLIGKRKFYAIVNNAAIQILGSAKNLTRLSWHQSININLLAPFFLSQSFLPELETNSGTIINIGSIHGELTKPDFLCYSTSKKALVGLTRGMAIELGKKIRINSISPGAVNTDMLKKGFENNSDKIEELERFIPQGRISDAEDIAQLVNFLCSNQSLSINGSNVTIDGGVSSRLYDPQ